MIVSKFLSNRFIFRLVLIFWMLVKFIFSYGQNGQDTVRQVKIFSGIISPNEDQSVYTALQNIWYANERASYLALPYFKPIINPKIPLREGEGKNGYLFEGNLLYQVPILMGRNHGNHLWQTQRLTFDYGFNIRMTTDPSNPLIPNNNVIGFAYDKYLWDSHTRFRPFYKSLKYSFDDWNELEKPLKSLSLNISAHHFSNGQPPGFFLISKVDSQEVVRNDYLRGDFSTNYLKLGLTYSYMNKKRSLFSAQMGYQRDGSVFGPLNFSDEQRQSYGQNRVFGFIQYKYIWRNKSPNRVTAVDLNSGQKIYTKIYKAYELNLRLDFEYILGNLSQYTFDNKYRFNPHITLQYTRPNWRALGFILHYYRGRDYSNMRYDLPVNAIMGGLSLSINKYKPPFSSKQKFH